MEINGNHCLFKQQQYTRVGLLKLDLEYCRWDMIRYDALLNQLELFASLLADLAAVK